MRTVPWTTSTEMGFSCHLLAWALVGWWCEKSWTLTLYSKQSAGNFFKRNFDWFFVFHPSCRCLDVCDFQELLGVWTLQTWIVLYYIFISQSQQLLMRQFLQKTVSACEWIYVNIQEENILFLQEPKHILLCQWCFYVVNAVHVSLTSEPRIFETDPTKKYSGCLLAHGLKRIGVWKIHAWWKVAMGIRWRFPVIRCPFESQFLEKMFSRWWFQTFFIFTPIWGGFPFWLILFRWVVQPPTSFFWCKKSWSEEGCEGYPTLILIVVSGWLALTR